MGEEEENIIKGASLKRLKENVTQHYPLDYYYSQSTLYIYTYTNQYTC